MKHVNRFAAWVIGMVPWLLIGTAIFLNWKSAADGRIDIHMALSALFSLIMGLGFLIEQAIRRLDR